MTAKVSLAAVDVHPVKEKFRDGIARAFRALGKSLHKSRSVPLPAGAAVQYYNLFSHMIHPSRLNFVRQRRRLLAAVCFFDVADIQDPGNQHLADHLPFI